MKHWSEFEVADFEELKQFHEQKVFVKVKIDKQPTGCGLCGCDLGAEVQEKCPRFCQSFQGQIKALRKRIS